jgi:hypothetical protein
VIEVEETVRNYESGQEPGTEAQSGKKAYEKPMLTAFEDLKTVTGSNPS